MAFLGPFNAAVPNPGFVELGKAFHRPVQIVTYSTTTAIITGGVAVSILCYISTLAHKVEARRCRPRFRLMLLFG